MTQPWGPPPASRAWLGRTPDPGARVASAVRRHRIPYLVAGVLLIVVCTAGVVLLLARVGDRTAVLALARPVGVGHVLAAADLRQVSMSADPGIEVLSASQAQAVVGQPVAHSLPAGTLLSRAALGAPHTPPQGQGVVAVAAQPGQFAPGLASGTTVSVILRSVSSASVPLPVISGPGRWWNAAVR